MSDLLNHDFKQLQWFSFEVKKPVRYMFTFYFICQFRKRLKQQNLCARESPPPSKPRAFQKIGQMPAQLAIFFGKCPATRSYYDGQMHGPPVLQTDKQNILVAIF